MVNGSLLMISRWTEKNKNVYPFKYEDGLRYLLPNRFKNRGRDWIMLSGPSSAREGFLYDRFNQAFPDMETYQEALSLGTIDDLMISLQYIEKVYGPNVLPKVLVLGVSPRFVANIPDKRPFILGINRYSPFYSVEQDADKLYLVQKKKLEGVGCRIRFFMFKQRARYRTTLATCLGLIINADLIKGNDQKKVTHVIDIHHSLVNKVLNNIIQFVKFNTSPYRYIDYPNVTEMEMRKRMHYKGSWWKDVHSWDPATDMKRTIKRLNDLKEFTSQFKIRMYVVNLPEHVASRELYDPTNYQRYIDLLIRSLPDLSFLNFREILENNEFHDMEHPNRIGAINLTDRVIEFILKENVKTSLL